MLNGRLLSNNDLSGRIPAELERLANLRLFSVCGNEELGPVPENLQAVPSSGYDLLWGGE